MPATTPTEREALTILERGHREVMRLIDGLPPRALTTTGIGGGAWSPADLVGHLAAWEGFALGGLARPTWRAPLGLRVGSILGGPGGPFRHADAHLPDLRAFVSSHARRS